MNSTDGRDGQTGNGPCLHRTWWIIAAFSLLWLTSCEASGTTTFGLASPEFEPTPIATLEPVAPTTANANATVAPTAPATARETTEGGTGGLAIAPLVADEVRRFELLELEIQTGIVPSNPFDPDELDIRVDFTPASGKTVEVGAFWYQDYDETGLRRVGEPGWRARFTPTETGSWTAVARIPARGLQSKPVSFQVTPSDNPGFIRVNPSNPRYFAFDDGSFFFPIGLNMAWWSGAGDALTDYKKWMDPFAANGGDTIRVWMAEWSFGLEWNDTPLGDYTNRLRRAWLLDQIFDMAEERDMYVLLVLLNCADFNNWQTNGWFGNPYNAARGGPLESPDQFVTDPEARAFLQRKLNYIANRWGYSPRLLAWEWWNEVNLAPFPDATLIPWLQEMTAYLKAQDVNRHLVTNSYAISDTTPTWELPEMEIIQKHEYAHQEDTLNKDLAERVAADLATLMGNAPPKPALLGEFGYGTEGYGNDVDKTGIHLHNGIWATTFAGYAGSGMYWFWDVYMEVYRAWFHFRGLSRFLEDIDLSRYQPFSPLEISGPGGGPGQAAGLGMRGDDILIWLRNEGYTTQASVAAWEDAGSPGVFLYDPLPVEGQTIKLRDLEDGEYTVQWFDPQSGKWLDPVEATAEGGQLSILIPDFRRDMAARIVPK